MFNKKILKFIEQPIVNVLWEFFLLILLLHLRIFVTDGTYSIPLKYIESGGMCNIKLNQYSGNKKVISSIKISGIKSNNGRTTSGGKFIL